MMKLKPIVIYIFVTSHFLSLGAIAEDSTTKLQPLVEIEVSDDSYWVQHRYFVRPLL